MSAERIAELEAERTVIDDALREASGRIVELETSIVAAREALRVAGARVVMLEAELEGERVNAKEDRRVHGELYRHVRDIANDVNELAHDVSTGHTLDRGKLYGELRSIRDRLRRRAAMHAPRTSAQEPVQLVVKLPAAE